MKFDQENLFRTLRLSDLPRRKWWGFVVKVFKTVEILLFKLLETFEVYRPQKSIVGIPSIATRGFTNISALVYNGTQEEVLGFRPRRMLHRILKGLPDLEAFERVRFQLAVSESTLRTIEASTETRGFIHLNLPWQLPLRAARSAWLRMTPVGVEILGGRVKLGDYEVLSSPVFFLNEQVKWVVISDIDDTIKDSHIAETTGLKKILHALFKGHYYSYEPITGMPEIYQKLAELGVLIVYVTSTPYQLAPFLLKFLRESHFPEGPLFLRWLGYGRFSHKWRTIFRLLSNIDSQRCILIGDSGEEDLQIYRRICETEDFREKVERILIRHVPGTPLQPVQDEREAYYNTTAELQALFERIIK